MQIFFDRTGGFDYAGQGYVLCKEAEAAAAEYI